MRRIALLVLAFAAVPILPASAVQQEIVGGRPASRPYPAMASLQSNTGSHFCGGSLVRPDWILTAKHCVNGRQPGSFRIWLGSTSKSTGGTVHQTTQVIVHSPSQSDSAVVKIDPPSTIAPIRIGMPEEANRWTPGTKAIATGWGTSFYLVGPSPDQLHEVEVPIVSDADCATLNGPTVGHNGAYEICAGEQTGGKDTCQGDSGGPLMVPDGRGRLIVIGTTWKGLGCGVPLFYGAYASVGEGPINEWLRSVLPPESSIAATDASADEADDDRTVAVTIRKAGTTAQASSVAFRTVAGSAAAKSDFWPVSGTVTFAADDTTQTIFVPILGDDAAEGAETFTIELSSPENARITAATATVTISDDD
ncbi:MAG TPA: trypsin-like serine protease [Actinomycetota bacterium]|nr:trypsin-like serine protease [Actinomycetota bacterium]